MSARYHMGTEEVMEVAPHWVGRPREAKEQVFALFQQTNELPDLGQRWYVYGEGHDAIPVAYDKLPEAVRMAYLLTQ